MGISPSSVSPVIPPSVDTQAPTVENLNGWELIFEETFEGDVSGHFASAKIVENRGYSSDFAARLRKQQKLISVSKGAADYSEEKGESFTLDVKFDNSPWTEEGRWTRGDSFNNEE